MDLSLLLTAPVMLFIAVVVILSGWIGYAVGKSREVTHKEAALADAEMTRKVSLNELRAHHERKLDSLVMAHAEQIDQLKKGQATDLERLAGEHSELIRRLNDSNNANLSALKKDQEQQVKDLDQRHRAEMEQVGKDHAEATQARESAHRHAMETLRAEHQERAQQMHDEHLRLELERDQLTQRVAELDKSIVDLNHRIKETRFNNMLSVSKSGEKLIRVVRSVQELATELDETSRAVTEGEYSFFAEIKDMRDREAVLRLAGETPQGSGAEPSGPGVEAPGSSEGNKDALVSGEPVVSDTEPVSADIGDQEPTSGQAAEAGHP